MRPMEASSELKHSPLEKEHAALGAKLGPFGGWLMPIEYAGALAEHRAVRERVGLFDVSHMGEFFVEGAGARGFLQSVLSNDLDKIGLGQAQLGEDGLGVAQEDLAGVRFDGEVWAVPEGTIVHADEPILEVTAPIAVAQLVETAMLNRITLHTTLASKAARYVLAAEGRDLVDFSFRRTHGMDAAMAAARSSAISSRVMTRPALRAKYSSSAYSFDVSTTSSSAR